ncbi:hypothetical protein FLONG3_5695 [Fusarium longipes]|uniref:Uncharacterized protein n=1 Tax=Fusarium longipes TaxID=694270 RepID=A0A395STQ8_9HYPO|nr:hypothetical protein FLONG3_5695 [Fusarium longipes]
MRFFILLLLIIRLSVGIASHFFSPASLRLGGNRASKEECLNGAWQSHMVPELLSIYWTGSKKRVEFPTDTEGIISTPVLHNRTSTDGEMNEEYSECRNPSYFNYEEKVMNGGIIMEEKPAGFTLLENKPWVPADLMARGDHEQQY